MRHSFHILCISFVLFLGLGMVWSSDWYVDGGASGASAGTSWKDAWRSFSGIRWGSGGVQPGDTLYISGGTGGRTYRESLSVPLGGTESSRITIRVGQDASHGGLVVLDGGLSLPTGISLNRYVTLDGSSRNGKIGLRIQRMTQKGISAEFSKDLPGIRVRHVEIVDCGTEASGETKPGYAHGIHFLNARDTEISHTVIHGSYKDGINLGGSTGGWGSNRIHHNHIYDNGDDGITGGEGMDVYNNLIHGHWNLQAGHPDGVQILGNYARIYNNVSYDNVNSQIFWDPTVKGIDAAHARIYNNLVYLTDRVGGYARGIAVKGEKDTTGVSDLVIANNTIVDMAYFGIGIDSNGGRISDVAIMNNIVYNAGLRANQAVNVYNFGSSSNVRIDYNQVHAGPAGDGEIRFGSTFVQAHGNASIPAFSRYSQKAGSNDFRILSTVYPSGADMSVYFTTDMDGSSRSSWTPGCYIVGRNRSGSMISDLPAGTGTDTPPGVSNPAGGPEQGVDGAPASPTGFRILR